MLSILGVTVGAVLAVAGLFLLAVHRDYLLVMYWYDRGCFVFQAKGDGQYRLISPAWIPVALLGFVAHGAAVVPTRLSHWAQARLHRRVSWMAGVKA